MIEAIPNERLTSVYIALGDYFFIYLGAFPHCPSHGSVIHLKKPESGPKAIIPLKVIEKRPMEISLDRDALFLCADNLLNMTAYKFRALHISCVRNAIFSDIDRLIEFRNSPKKISKALRIYFPSHIRYLSGVLPPKTDSLIVIHADKIKRSRDARNKKEISKVINQGANPGMCTILHALCNSDLARGIYLFQNRIHLSLGSHKREIYPDKR